MVTREFTSVCSYVCTHAIVCVCAVGGGEQETDVKQINKYITRRG